MPSRLPLSNIIDIAYKPSKSSETGVPDKPTRHLKSFNLCLNFLKPTPPELFNLVISSHIRASKPCVSLNSSQNHGTFS